MTSPLALALDAARAAGRVLLVHYGRPLPVDTKADGSPLTQADTEAHRAAVGRLRAGSGLPVLSEESPPEEMAGRAGWRRFWCVDPLDGTKEFVKGPADPSARSGEFTVNVALVEDGAPTLGVVHVPALGVTYWAAGGRAWKQTGEAAPRPIRTRPAGSPLAVAVSRDHSGPETAALLDRIRADGWAVRAVPAASALKVCLVAEGATDLYPRLGPTSEWDTAAAQAVVEAAGGGLGTRGADRLAYNKADLLNPPFVAWGDPALDWRRWLDTGH